MSRSYSFGNQTHRFDLAVAGAREHVGELPKEAARLAASLEAAAARAREMGAAQEKAKQDVVVLTQEVKKVLAEGNSISGKIVRLAEATFGPRHPRLREFRPATEGKATKRGARAGGGNGKSSSAPAPVLATK